MNRITVNELVSNGFYTEQGECLITDDKAFIDWYLEHYKTEVAICEQILEAMQNGEVKTDRYGAPKTVSMRAYYKRTFGRSIPIKYWSSNCIGVVERTCYDDTKETAFCLPGAAPAQSLRWLTPNGVRPFVIRSADSIKTHYANIIKQAYEDEQKRQYVAEHAAEINAREQARELMRDIRIRYPMTLSVKEDYYKPGCMKYDTEATAGFNYNTRSIKDDISVDKANAITDLILEYRDVIVPIIKELNQKMEQLIGTDE